MKSVEVECEAYGFGESGRYTDGLERIELYVEDVYVSSLARLPKAGERQQVTFSTPTGDYEGGIRCYQGQWPYLCPNLISKKNGERISLARVLRDNGINPRDRVRIRVSEGQWILLGLRQDALSKA